MDTQIKMFDKHTGKNIRTFVGHTKPITYLTTSSNNQLLISGSEDGMVKIWNVEKGKCIKTFQDHTSSIVSIKFITDNDIMTSGSNGSII